MDDAEQGPDEDDNSTWWFLLGAVGTVGAVALAVLVWREAATLHDALVWTVLTLVIGVGTWLIFQVQDLRFRLDDRDEREAYFLDDVESYGKHAGRRG